MNLAALDVGLPGRGVGGEWGTRSVDTLLTLDSVSMPLVLTILAPPPGPIPFIPSLLGRDILARFALFMEERTSRVLLLEPHEVEALHFPEA